MSIRIVCPNGHELKIKEKYAGKKGFCPICKARVEVPVPQNDVFSEDSIMDVLQPHESGLSLDAVNQEPASDKPWSGREEDVHVRLCGKCYKEIPVDAYICPFCRTYIRSGYAAIYNEIPH